MDDMLGYLYRSWWLFLLRGIAAIVLGVMAFAWPALTLALLVLLFGAYVLVDGIFGLIHAIRYRDRVERVWPWVLEAVLGIAVGLLTLLMPGITALALLMFIAAWAIVIGVLRIVLAIQLRKQISGEWFMVAGGLLSVLFGVLLVALPQAGLISLVWLIGFYAVLVGIVFILLALRLRKAGEGATGHT